MEDTPRDLISEKPQKSLSRSFIREGLAYIGELIRVVVISLAIILPIRYFLAQPFYVKGASMEPNFYDHEYLIIDELSYRFRDPVRGDIVVFRYPNDPSQFFIKRVVGLPGETVQLNRGKVYVEKAGQTRKLVLEEPYLGAGAVTQGSDSQQTLGLQEYYLLGDNRTASLDSRQFGAVRREYIIGRAWLRGWPIDRISRFLAPVYELDQETVKKL